MSRAGEGSELNGVIGVDIGGTKMAAARVSSGGSLAGDIHAVASSGQSEEGLVDALLGLLNAEIRRNGPPQAVGLGCAGTVHRKFGVAVVSPNLPLRGTSLVSLVEDALDLPTFLDNDANVAALAEAVSYTHLRAHETKANLVCRLLLEKNKNNQTQTNNNYSERQRHEQPHAAQDNR